MPRTSWSGFLRLSLVSCPVYLSPATTRTKSLRLHQVWRPAAGDEPGPEEPDRDRDGQVAAGSRPQPADPRETERADQATRIALRPHDPRTGEEIEKSEVVKGYEYGRGQFVTFNAEELKALDVESSKVVDLESFVPRGDIDAVYFDSAYYLYPDGPIAVEALRVIGAAMTETGVTGIGRLVNRHAARNPPAFAVSLLSGAENHRTVGSQPAPIGTAPRRRIFERAQYLAPVYG